MAVVFDIKGGPLDGRFATTGPPPSSSDESKRRLEEVIAWSLWYSVPPSSFAVGYRFYSFSLAGWQRVLMENKHTGLARRHVYEVIGRDASGDDTLIRADYVGPVYALNAPK